MQRLYSTVHATSLLYGTLRYAQRLYVRHKTLLLQLMVYFMAVVGVLDVAMQRLKLRETKPCFTINIVFYGRCWRFRRCNATSLRETKPCYYNYWCILWPLLAF